MDFGYAKIQREALLPFNFSTRSKSRTDAAIDPYINANFQDSKLEDFLKHIILAMFWVIETLLLLMRSSWIFLKCPALLPNTHNKISNTGVI